MGVVEARCVDQMDELVLPWEAVSVDFGCALCSVSAIREAIMND